MVLRMLKGNATSVKACPYIEEEWDMTTKDRAGTVFDLTTSYIYVRVCRADGAHVVGRED